LERAYNKSDQVGITGGRMKCATGMSYLIRNGSILQDIIEMWQQHHNCKNSTSSIDGVLNAADATAVTDAAAATDDAVKRGRKRSLDSDSFD
jgi:hypothetical protein